MRPFQVLATVLTAAMLLVATLLSAIDHHLAERIPGHAHLVTANAAPALWAGRVARHTHSYQGEHTHYGYQSVSGMVAMIAINVGSVAAIVTPQAGPASAWFSLAGPWLAPNVVISSADLRIPVVNVALAAPIIHITDPLERPPITAS